VGGRLAALAAGELRLAADLLAARRRAAAHRTAAARRLGRLGEHERAGVGLGQPPACRASASGCNKGWTCATPCASARARRVMRTVLTHSLQWACCAARARACTPWTPVAIE